MTSLHPLSASPPPDDAAWAAERLAHAFETLTPQSLPQLVALYGPQASFKDPFNEVVGTETISRIFQHMFATLEEPRFVVAQRVVQGQHCFLTWNFHFRFKRLDTTTRQTIRGASHLVFDEQGLVTLHRDYWDAAEELYEKLPVLGILMRWLKRRTDA